MCTVSSVQHHAVFAKMDEYGSTGLIHISEVSPGRIRNIRDYVVEGKKIVCKVLRINKERGHIDLSLRRVNEGQRRNKISDIKQEQKAEKIVEYVAKKNKKDVKELYASVSQKALKKYPSLFAAFEDVLNDEQLLVKLGIESDFAASLTEIIKQRIKPAEVHVGGNLMISSYAPNGVDVVKEAIAVGEAKVKEGLTVRYEGGGRFKVLVKAGDYKHAEKFLADFVDTAISYVEKTKGTGEFQRIEVAH